MTLHARLTALRDDAWRQLEACDIIDTGLLRLVADTTVVLQAIEALGLEEPDPPLARMAAE
jgi:hypothetical protein